MSILCDNDRGWVLDHSGFIENVYRNVKVEKLKIANDELYSQCCLNNNLFKIITPFLFESEAINLTVTKGLKRKKSSMKLTSNKSAEVLSIKSALEELVILGQKSGYFTKIIDNEDIKNNNEDARNFSKWFFSEICSTIFTKCSGGNTAEIPIIVNIHGQSYLLPDSCKFFCCDVKELCTKLPEFSQFHFILLDPPWWNKYIRRRKTKQESAGYKMMYNEEVCTLPISSWLAPGGLVAVWCTNSTSHIRDITSQWFPNWGLKHVATWYWVKVTQSGQPVCQFSSPPGKQPYERIVFGIPEGRQVPSPPDHRCIVSVPSAIHSHKPPLSDVLKLYLPPHPSCLELFARYLLPHWTSVGDQVLALQNLKLFDQIKIAGSYDLFYFIQFKQSFFENTFLRVKLE